MAYNPNGQVVQNATALSDLIDDLKRVATGAQGILDVVVARIAALENPPIPATAIKNDTGGYVLNDAGGYVLTGA